MVQNNVRRGLATVGISLALGTPFVGAQTASTQSAVDRIRHRQGTIRLFDVTALQNWTLEVIARDDGWVELALATVARDEAGFRRWASDADPLPWIIGDAFGSSKRRAPVWSRALFTPAEIRRTTQFADSLLDGTLTPEVYATRFSRGAPTILARMKGSRTPPDHSILSWYMFPPVKRGSVEPGTVDFGIGSCLGMESAAELMGRGVVRNIADYRAMLRLLDSAADRSASKPLASRPLSPDVVTAEQAGCTAIPLRDLRRPSYPADGGDQVIDVQLDAIIDTSGTIEPQSVQLVAAGGAAFDAAAVIALTQLRFAPALLTTATPVRQRVRVQVHFAPRELTDREVNDIAVRAARAGAEILVLSEQRR